MKDYIVYMREKSDEYEEKPLVTIDYDRVDGGTRECARLARLDNPDLHLVRIVEK